MVTGQQIVDEARKYLGTPFHHQGRVKNVGVDCIGLLTGVAKTLGITDYDNTTYSRNPDGKTLIAELKKIADEISIEAARLGDILVFWISPKSKKPQHVAFKTDRGMIHTYSHVDEVVETSIGAPWKRRLVGAYRLRGVQPYQECQGVQPCQP